MLYKISLKNDVDKVILDADTYQFLTQGYYKEINLLSNLRKHQRGYAVFQRMIGKGKYETIYLHKLIAETFINKPKDWTKHWVITFKDMNPLNLRLKNLQWVSRAYIRRRSDYTNSQTGQKGVHQDGNRYVATIYLDGSKKPLIIGRYDTAEEAGEAYRQKRKELFGL